MLFKKEKDMKKHLIVLSVLIAVTVSGCATDTKQKKGGLQEARIFKSLSGRL